MIRQEVNCETGEVVERELTADEIAALEATAQTYEGEESAAANADAIRDRLSTSVEQLRAGVDAIQAGTLFQGLSNQERAFLRLLARTASGLARLELRELDSQD